MKALLCAGEIDPLMERFAALFSIGWMRIAGRRRGFLLLLAGMTLAVGAGARANAVTFSETLLDDGTSATRFSTPAPNPGALKLFRGADTDWAALIDSTWGPAPWPVADQLTWFDAVRDTLDRRFACFEGIVDNFDSLATAYRSEIAGGVSQGRLAAIFNHFTLSLQESHTSSYLPAVNSTELAPGVPLMVIGAWGANDHFGAGLTPLPDKSLLVYDAVPAHPLGLVPGDIVLGYESVPWEQLSQDLLDAQLPLWNAFFWGSSPSSLEHSLMMAAGMNWHLFNTIDVVKYDTGDTVNMSTAPLVGASMEIYCMEQLPIPGVNSPDPPTGRLVTRGRVSGTNIGYIYVTAWAGNAGSRFLLAVNALYDTAGLIIDFRTNFGGDMFLSNNALAVLFDHVVPTINWDIRCPGGGHLDMCSAGEDSTFYDIPGDPATSYNKPIAVLVGPGAVSSGDQVALRMKFHPHVRVFGKSTATAFNSPIYGIDTGGGPITADYAEYDSYLLSDPLNHLTHDEFAVDESVWLAPDDVAQGVDTVVEAALAWIQSQVTDVQRVAKSDLVPALSNSPNPFRSLTTIQYSALGTKPAALAIYDVSGRLVRTLVGGTQEANRYEVTWDGRDVRGGRLASGIYFVRLETKERALSRKIVLLK